MTIINKNTVVVFSDLELKEVLESNNEYTYIYFGNNVSLSTGISISSSKSEVIIDGTYKNVTYEYTDQKKLGTGDAIAVISPLTKKVTVKNMKVTGYNYYGIIYVPDTDSYKDIVIEYTNINYIGPQISFNPRGLTRFIDDIITIQDSYASGNEVAECNKIEIGGNTTINHKSTSNSSFWFRNQNPTMTILNNAVVNFTSTSRELFYGVKDLMLTISKNASFYVTSYNGLAYGNYGTGTTLIDENAVFSLSKTNYNGSYATWYSYGEITLNSGSSLVIINDFPNIISSNYNIYFQGKQAGLILNNPLRLVLYNSIGNVISATDTTSFKFNYSRINLFDKAISMLDDISVQTLPTYSWYKSDNLSTINGTFTSTATTISDNNYTEEELNSLPGLTNFNIANKKIISVGTVEFMVNALTDTDTMMSGVTDINSSVLIEFNNFSTVVRANEDGEFSYSYTDTLPIGTVITFTVKKYNDVLYFTKKIQIVYSGELVLSSATKDIKFDPTVLSTNPVICPRLADIDITVSDSRINSTNWKLYASISHDLMSSDGLILKESLIYVDDDGTKVLSTIPVLVYTGEENGGVTKVTNINWAKDKGILLCLNDPLMNNVEYETKIIWTIEE